DRPRHGVAHRGQRRPARHGPVGRRRGRGAVRRRGGRAGPVRLAHRRPVRDHHDRR
ncbi:MAG: hypothetical protein AVDCRST_MAG41-662, partial [uncultured Corynebacteriales bacterium]